MISLSGTTAILVALGAGAWLALAVGMTIRGWRFGARGADVLAERDRLVALVEAGPALPLLVWPDGRLEAPRRLAQLVDGGSLPDKWNGVLPGLDDQGQLAGAVEQAALTGSSFALTLPVADASAGAARYWRVSGSPAPPPFPRRTVLLWLLDISESEAAKADLGNRLARRTEALDSLSRLIELAPFPMWHRGPDMRLAMVNSAYVAAVEAEDAAEVVSRGVELTDDVHFDSSEAARLREGRESVRRTSPVTIRGERRMMDVVEIPLGNEGVAGYAIDIEDREEARAELTRFARAQRDMLDRLSAGVAQFARDRSLVFFNQPFARLFSLGADFLADQPEFDRLIDAMRNEGKLPEVRDFPEWKEAHRGWFTSGLSAEEEDWLLSGGKHLRVVAQPLPDGGLLLIFEDRTEQIQLASSRDTLLRVRSATFDNLFEAVGVFASDGRLNLWNSRFRDLWEFEEEELGRHPRVDSLTAHLATRLKQPRHAGLVRELVRSATQERKQRSGRVTMIDGREFEFAAVPLPDGNALFTMLDITDSRKVEAALRERNEALEEADRLKTAFVSNMSYELRTPLTSISGFAEMLEAGHAGELPGRAKDYVGAILVSVARLGALIDNVLDLTQSDTGSLLLAEEEVDLAVLSEEMAQEMRAAAERKGIEFVTEIDPSAGVVTGDRRRLGQAIAKVLGNSLMYTDEGGRILLHVDGRPEETSIIVSDNGRGIAPADQEKVFDRFHRTVDSRSEEGAALGLGLSLARQFVEAHGGTISLESRVGEGTTVTITLPRTREQQVAYGGSGR